MVASRVAFNPLGTKISEVLGKRVPGISTSNGPGGGVANVRYVDRGGAEIGWRYGDTAGQRLSGHNRAPLAAVRNAG